MTWVFLSRNKRQLEKLTEDAEEQEVERMKGFSRLHKVGEYWQLRHIEQYWRETLKHVVVYALWLGTFFRKFYVKAAAQAKFAEIDEDDSGELEGEEIDDLLDWIFQYVQHDDGTPLSAIDRAAERYHFRRRLDPDDDGSITFDELHTCGCTAPAAGSLHCSCSHFNSNTLIHPAPGQVHLRGRTGGALDGAPAGRTQAPPPPAGRLGAAGGVPGQALVQCPQQVTAVPLSRVSSSDAAFVFAISTAFAAKTVPLLLQFPLPSQLRQCLCLCNVHCLRS